MTPNPDPTSPTALAEYTARAADQLAVLTRYGMNLARLTHDTADHLAPQLLATNTPAYATERLAPLTKSFDRLARTVRQCMALELRLHTTADRPATARVRTPAQSHGRRQIIRQVEDAIATQTPAPERENLLRDLYERLEDPEIDDDLAARPLDVIIHQIRGDLGLTPRHPDARRRSAADIRTLNQRAGTSPPPPSPPPSSTPTPTPTPPSSRSPTTIFTLVPATLRSTLPDQPSPPPAPPIPPD